MKSVACVLLCVLAVAVADTGFQQQQQYYQQQQYQSAPSSYNNYYDYNQRPQQQGFFDRISTGIRRQGLGGLLAGLGLGGAGGAAIAPIGIIIAVAVAGLVAVGILAVVVNQLNNSGRGLDSDDWEVNHSVWMDQLQKDFEESWSVE